MKVIDEAVVKDDIGILVLGELSGAYEFLEAAGLSPDPWYRSEIYIKWRESSTREQGRFAIFCHRYRLEGAWPWDLLLYILPAPLGPELSLLDHLEFPAPIQGSVLILDHEWTIQTLAEYGEIFDLEGLKEKKIPFVVAVTGKKIAKMSVSRFYKDLDIEPSISLTPCSLGFNSDLVHEILSKLINEMEARGLLPAQTA